MKKSLTFFSTLLISLSTISNINKNQGIFTKTIFKTALNSTTIITSIQKVIKTINDDINNQFKTLEDPALGLQDRLDEFQRLDEHITNFSKQLKQLQALLLVSKVISSFNKKNTFNEIKDNFIEIIKRFHKMRDFLAKLNTLGITERDMMLALVWKQIKYLENEQQNLIIEITKIVEFEKEEDNNELIKEIKTFFLNKYDFNLNEDNTQEDAIKKVNEKLSQNLINKENKKVIIKLWDYQNNNNNLQLKEMSIYLAIYINDKLINDQIYQPIKLHLINITISKKNQMILNKIINYFEKEFDYNEHKFTTNNTRYDAFELVKILIQNLYW